MILSYLGLSGSLRKACRHPFCLTLLSSKFRLANAGLDEHHIRGAALGFNGIFSVQMLVHSIGNRNIFRFFMNFLDTSR